MFQTKYCLVFGLYLRNYLLFGSKIFTTYKEDKYLQLSYFDRSPIQSKKGQTGAASKPNPTVIQTEHVGVVGPYLPIYLSDHYE